MKIATYNVNGVNGRLPRLLEWLAETDPDIACLQELKTDDTKFPAKALEAAGYGGSGTASARITAWPSSLRWFERFIGHARDLISFSR